MKKNLIIVCLIIFILYESNIFKPLFAKDLKIENETVVPVKNDSIVPVKKEIPIPVKEEISVPVINDTLCLPAINRIDIGEQNIINKYGEEWLINFYGVWEAGKTDPQYNEIIVNNKDGNSFKSLLENDMDAFIIDGRLFVLSYKPDSAINESDNNARNAYNFAHNDKHNVWIYEKNIKAKSELNDGKWLTANNAPLFLDILGENCNGNSMHMAYCPSKIRKTDEHFIIKSNKYNGYVLILCTFKCNSKYANKLITLSPLPTEGYPDGYVYYDYSDYTNNPVIVTYDKWGKRYQSDLLPFYYPVKFTGQNKNGTISTISSTGKVETIDLYLDKDCYGGKIDSKRISFNSEGYGWQWCQPTENSKY